MALSAESLTTLRQKLRAVFLANLQKNISSEQLDAIWLNFKPADKLTLAQSFIRKNTEGTDVLVSALTKSFQIIADQQADAILKAGSADLETLLLILTG